MNKEKCIAITSTGEPCSAYALSDSQYCWSHESSLEDKRHEARQLGGRKRKYISGIPASISTIDDILCVIEETIGNLQQMDISIAQARTLLTACVVAMQALEFRDLSNRVEKLEETILDKRS